MSPTQSSCAKWRIWKDEKQVAAWMGTEGRQCVLLYIKASMLISWPVMWGWAARGGSIDIWTTLLCFAGQVRQAANAGISAKLEWKCTGRHWHWPPAAVTALTRGMLPWKNTKYTGKCSNNNCFKSSLKPIMKNQHWDVGKGRRLWTGKRKTIAFMLHGLNLHDVFMTTCILFTNSHTLTC